MEAVISDVLDKVIDQIEGEVGRIRGDRGGLTVFGLSERYHRDFVNRYTERVMVEDPDAVRAAMLPEAKEIYYRGYVQPILGWQWLASDFPALLTLLVSGRIHGAGFRHYVEEVQRYTNKVRALRGQVLLVVDGRWGPKTLAAIKALDSIERGSLINYLGSPSVLSSLIRRRQQAVQSGGAVGVDAGIANRVRKELALATDYPVDAGVVAANEWTSVPGLIEVSSRESRTSRSVCTCRELSTDGLTSELEGLSRA